jgi:proteasome lid subunit RPN8/RPN11
MKMLQILQSVYEQLRSHGEATYPDECCGILLGAIAPEARIVTQAIPVPNTAPNPRSHYQIAPGDLIRILREARVENLEIAGFYHSHPDHPARWSSTDLAEAHWLGCSYLITAVADGHAAQTNAFHLAGQSEEDKRFEAEEISLQTHSPNENQSPA